MLLKVQFFSPLTFIQAYLAHLQSQGDCPGSWPPFTRELFESKEKQSLLPFSFLFFSFHFSPQISSNPTLIWVDHLHLWEDSSASIPFQILGLIRDTQRVFHLLPMQNVRRVLEFSHFKANERSWQQRNGTKSEDRPADPNIPKLRNDCEGATKILPVDAALRDRDSIPNNTIS